MKKITDPLKGKQYLFKNLIIEVLKAVVLQDIYIRINFVLNHVNPNDFDEMTETRRFEKDNLDVILC